MKKYTKASDIRKTITRLGKTWPVTRYPKMVQVRYEVFGKSMDTTATEEAMRAGFDPKVYTGTVEQVFSTVGTNPQFCFTMRVLERTKGGKYQARTFNLNKGRARWLKVL